MKIFDIIKPDSDSLNEVSWKPKFELPSWIRGKEPEFPHDRVDPSLDPVKPSKPRRVLAPNGERFTTKDEFGRTVEYEKVNRRWRKNVGGELRELGTDPETIKANNTAIEKQWRAQQEAGSSTPTSPIDTPQPTDATDPATPTKATGGNSQRIDPIDTSAIPGFRRIFKLSTTVLKIIVPTGLGISDYNQYDKHFNQIAQLKEQREATRSSDPSGIKLIPEKYRQSQANPSGYNDFEKYIAADEEAFMNRFYVQVTGDVLSALPLIPVAKLPAALRGFVTVGSYSAVGAVTGGLTGLNWWLSGKGDDWENKWKALVGAEVVGIAGGAVVVPAILVGLSMIIPGFKRILDGLSILGLYWFVANLRAKENADAIGSILAGYLWEPLGALFRVIRQTSLGFVPVKNIEDFFEKLAKESELKAQGSVSSVQDIIEKGKDSDQSIANKGKEGGDQTIKGKEGGDQTIKGKEGGEQAVKKTPPNNKPTYVQRSDGYWVNSRDPSDIRKTNPNDDL